MTTEEIRKAHPILSRIPFLGRNVDERFLEHRRRSTSAAALAGALLLGILLEYDLIVHHEQHWDLFAVLCTMAGVKIGLMLWYRFHD
jgi:peptidoglycan biosynthesis protein MviN/MurJ (putative lipid II flippase)